MNFKISKLGFLGMCMLLPAAASASKIVETDYTVAATEKKEGSYNMRGSHQKQQSASTPAQSQRRLSNGNPDGVRGCTQAAYDFRYYYCQALVGEIDPETEWEAIATDFIATDIEASLDIPSIATNYTSRDEFLNSTSGLIAKLRDLAEGDFAGCVVSFGSNYRVKEWSGAGAGTSVAVMHPVEKSFEWMRSGGGGKEVRHEIEEYHCVKEGGKWKIQYYDDTNSVSSYKAVLVPIAD